MGKCYVVKWYEDKGELIWHEKVFRCRVEAEECFVYLRETGEVFNLTMREIGTA